MDNNYQGQQYQQPQYQQSQYQQNGSASSSEE